MRVSSLQKKRRKRRSGKGYDGPRSELYSNSSRKMQAAALTGSFTIVCRAAAVGRWLSVRLSVPRSCCRSSQLPGGEITEPKFQKKNPWVCGGFTLWVICYCIKKKKSSLDGCTSVCFVPSSCCRSSQLPGGEISKAKFKQKPVVA